MSQKYGHLEIRVHFYQKRRKDIHKKCVVMKKLSVKHILLSRKICLNKRIFIYYKEVQSNSPRVIKLPPRSMKITRKGMNMNIKAYNLPKLRVILL